MCVNYAEPLTAKIFQNGRSQAVRLPRAFRVNTNEVYIRKEYGKIIITPKEGDFASKSDVVRFFASIHDPGFEPERDLSAPQEREIF
jgi:antitoxin VapB